MSNMEKNSNHKDNLPYKGLKALVDDFYDVQRKCHFWNSISQKGRDECYEAKVRLTNKVVITVEENPDLQKAIATVVSNPIITIEKKETKHNKW